MQALAETTDRPTTAVWTGRILTGVAVLFLIFDGVTKLMKVSQVVEATAQLGFPERSIVWIGFVLLACTALYLIPRTAPLGALLLTAYLGGAVAAQVRVGNPVFNLVFAILFGVMVWAGLLLRDDRLRVILPLAREL